MPSCPAHVRGEVCSSVACRCHAHTPTHKHVLNTQTCVQHPNTRNCTTTRMCAPPTHPPTLQAHMDDMAAGGAVVARAHVVLERILQGEHSCTVRQRAACSCDGAMQPRWNEVGSEGSAFPQQVQHGTPSRHANGRPNQLVAPHADAAQHPQRAQHPHHPPAGRPAHRTGRPARCAPCGCSP